MLYQFKVVVNGKIWALWLPRILGLVIVASGFWLAGDYVGGRDAEESTKRISLESTLAGGEWNGDISSTMETGRQKRNPFVSGDRTALAGIKRKAPREFERSTASDLVRDIPDVMAEEVVSPPGIDGESSYLDEVFVDPLDDVNRERGEGTDLPPLEPAAGWEATTWDLLESERLAEEMLQYEIMAGEEDPLLYGPEWADTSTEVAVDSGNALNEEVLPLSLIEMERTAVAEFSAGMETEVPIEPVSE